MASEGAKDMTKSARDGDFLAWALLFLSVPPRSFPAPHSQPSGGIGGNDFLTPFSGCFFLLDDNK